MAALPIRHFLFFHMNQKSPAEVSGYRERSNRVIGNALFFATHIGFSGTFHPCFLRRFGLSGTRDRVFRNVSGYRERLIGLSGTTVERNGYAVGGPGVA
jgi:hypothetical protein